MKPSLKALPPSEWRIMYILWKHGPLTVLETQKLTPEHSVTTVATFLKRLVAKGYLTTALERSSPAGGRPPERFYPRVDYSTGLELVVQEFLADYIMGDPAGLSYLITTAQERLSTRDEILAAADRRDGAHLHGKPS
jgi:predicted transcriptional regulator